VDCDSGRALLDRGTSTTTDLVVPTGRSFTTNLFPFEDPEGENLGEVIIERNPTGAAAWVNSSGLTPSNAYTLWWTIWNDPMLCDGLCREPDVGLPANSVFFAASGIASSAGDLSFHARTSADGSIDGAALIPGGLTAPMRATIHLVVKDHEPALVGDALIAQLTQYETLATEGEVAGNGLTVDVQAAINDGPIP